MCRHHITFCHLYAFSEQTFDTYAVKIQSAGFVDATWARCYEKFWNARSIFPSEEQNQVIDVCSHVLGIEKSTHAFVVQKCIGALVPISTTPLIQHTMFGKMKMDAHKGFVACQIVKLTIFNAEATRTAWTILFTKRAQLQCNVVSKSEKSSTTYITSNTDSAKEKKENIQSYLQVYRWFWYRLRPAVTKKENMESSFYTLVRDFFSRLRPVVERKKKAWVKSAVLLVFFLGLFWLSSPRTNGSNNTTFAEQGEKRG